ncbi:MAG: HAD family phosphatase [Anaerolineae bacterium]|nr:HAD family phosphatase [Anaerolineae bacterium]
MAEIALIATDLDGTLLRSDGSLAPGGVAALRRARDRGLHVVLATTRNPDSARAYAREIGLTGPLICTAGAIILASPDGPTWGKALIPQRVAAHIAQVADDNDWELSITVGDISYVRQRPDQALGEVQPGVVAMPSNRDGVLGDVMRIAIWNPDGITRLDELCRAEYAAYVHTDHFDNPDGSPHALAIVAAGADKGTALRLVLARLGLSAAQALAIGDNHNDAPMFDVAGVSVAMGNAVAAIRAQAAHVAPHHDAEGVAWAVERFVLQT